MTTIGTAETAGITETKDTPDNISDKRTAGEDRRKTNVGTFGGTFQIRNIPPEVHKAFRIASLYAGITMEEYALNALIEKIKRESQVR